MKKQPFGKNDIAIDLKKEFTLKMAVLQSVAWGGVMALWIFAVSLIYNILHFDHWIFPALYALFLVIVGGDTIVYIVSTFIAVCRVRRYAANGNYQIVSDRLLRTKTGADRLVNGSRYWKPYLIFAEFGEYRIPENNYSWSDLYAMSDQGVYNTAITDDVFYIVTIGRKKP